MFGNDCRVSGIIDWDVATMGPRELDLGTFLFMNRAYTEGCRIENPGGFPEPAEAIARYEELSGHEVHNMHWYEALAAFRGSTLTMRAARLLIDMGVMPPDSTVPSTNLCSVTLASILDLPAPGGEVGWYSGRR
jgi:aminoglycoside phosphotransferase (APT) family kinase protein